MVKIEFAAFVDVHHPYLYILMTLKKLPWNDICVMLHDGEDNFVAVTETVAERGGNKIDSLGGAPCEDNFLDTRRIDPGANPATGAFL